MLAVYTQEYWFTWFPGSLLAVCGVLALVWKGIRSFNRILTATDDVMQVKAQTQANHDRLQRIEYEFHPNHGGSLRDQINSLRDEQGRVAINLTVANTQMANHIAADALAFGRQERTNTRVEATLDRIEDHVRGK